MVELPTMSKLQDVRIRGREKDPRGLRPNLALSELEPELVQIVEDPAAVASALSEPGIYIAESWTYAYHLLRAAMLRSDAALVGERSLPDGQKAIAVRAKTRANPKMMAIDPEAFKRVKQEYTDWPTKWWREAVQNSVDAGATEIRLSTEPQPDGTVRIICEDNGSGMDREAFEHKFMVFYGTSKVGARGAMGGFGKAKELLLLPWLSWRVHSRDMVAAGVANSWDFEPAPFYREGTRVEVLMAAQDAIDGVSATTLLSRSYLPAVRFWVQGQPVSAALKAKKRLRTLADKLELFFSDVETDWPLLIVRTGGLYMFSRDIPSVIKGNVIGEMLRPSIELLTSNRDAFRDAELLSAMWKFENELAVETRSALQTKQNVFRKVYKGTGPAVSGRDEAEILLATGPAHVAGPATMVIAPDGLARIAETLDSIQRARGQRGESDERTFEASPESAAHLMSGRFLGQDHLEAAMAQLVWQPDMIVVQEIAGFKVPRRFEPATMKPRVLKLLKTWTEMCRYVLIQLGSRVQYGVGWLFSEENGAAAVREGQADWLVLNPFRDPKTRREMLAPSRDEDLRWLYAAAIHEATHLVDRLSSHEQSFADAMTRNVARCADGYRKIRAIAASIRMREEEPEEDEIPALPPPRSIGTAIAWARHMSCEYFALDPGMPQVGEQRWLDLYNGDQEINALPMHPAIVCWNGHRWRTEVDRATYQRLWAPLP